MRNPPIPDSALQRPNDMVLAAAAPQIDPAETGDRAT